MEQLEWAIEENYPPPIQHDTIGAGQTPWLFLALDFRYTTGIRLCPSNEDEEKIYLCQLVRYFASAFKQVYRLSGYKFNLKIVQKVCTLQGLGLPKTAGLNRRAVLSTPGKVNEVLHMLAINMATDEKARTWRQCVTLPDMGPIKWTEYLSEVAKKRNETERARAKPRLGPRSR